MKVVIVATVGEEEVEKAAEAELRKAMEAWIPASHSVRGTEEFFPLSRILSSRSWKHGPFSSTSTSSCSST